MDYFQPDFYHFNEDSLKLVAEVLDSKVGASRVLDVGAGCGFIGIELAQKIKIDELHLLEVQKDFLPSMEQNLDLFIPQQNAFITIASLSEFNTSQKFDLILSNPPYYLPGKGQVNKDERRGICRSFQIDSWKDLINLFERFLAPQGKAFVVIKNDKILLKVIEEELIGRSLKSKLREQADLVFLNFYFEV